MERRPPVTPSDEIDLYVRTYTSLLRSSGEVRVRAFEESHAFSGSSLHPGALSPTPDVSAFAYAAARLPDEMPDIGLVVLGQSHELFEAAGLEVQTWRAVRTRGRRRPLRLDAERGTLAVFIASESDIDDFIPILTAYQLEWNKMHERLRPLTLADIDNPSVDELAHHLGLSVDDLDVLRQAFGGRLLEGILRIAKRALDVNVQLLAASYSQYQRSAQRWWSGVEPHYLRPEPPRRRPVYFVSSNTHAIANLVGGYARSHKEAILAYGREKNPEGLASTIEQAAERGEDEVLPFIYYLLRGYIHAGEGEQRMRDVRAFESAAGLRHLSEPGHIDVDAQIIEIAKMNPALLDPRLRVPGVEKAIAKSDAVILNIDYPLGMPAYHLLSRVGQGVGEVRGVYVMGKAATLNGRVGDVALSGVVFDEHSRNTFLFRNAFGARDVRPYLRYGSVFDNQSALSVRSAFLQNRNYMSAFYRDGYTVLEMEAGPFLGAVYELVHPTRIPQDEIINLASIVPFDVGFVHYASDTPYSRRQSLLSKSLSYFGVDSTYACAIAIVRRILAMEVERA